MATPGSDGGGPEGTRRGTSSQRRGPRAPRVRHPARRRSRDRGVHLCVGKMARTFLRHIRVQSWEELRQRILLGIAEINAAPVVHRWKKFDALTPADQSTI
jgi:hypothetical protein